MMEPDMVEHRLTELESNSESVNRRIETIEMRQDNLDKLVASVAVMTEEQEHIKSDVTEIKTNVKELTAKSGKRWDDLIDKIVWAILAAVIAFFLARIGL